MAGLLLFILGMVLGIFVTPWAFTICLIPILATVYWGNHRG